MEHEIACQTPNSSVNLRAESIPFSEIPGQSKLFVEYQADPLSLRRYYPNAVAENAQIAERVPEVLEHYIADRTMLCDALAETNRRVRNGPKVFENIELLRSNDTVAVVTGQQAGLFTGPLYTIYKALSAIAQAERLRQAGHNAVPVFWAATEDHDLDEVSNAFVIGRGGELAEVNVEARPEDDNMPVGKVKLDAEIKQAVAKLIDVLTPTQFTGDVREVLDANWRSGEYFGDAFGKMLARLLGDRGLIILDPLDAKMKQLAAPVYAAAISHSREIVDALKTRSSELINDGYAAQVLVGDDYFPLFWHDNEGRRIQLRRTTAGAFRAKNGSREFSIDELAEIAVSEPERFSPSVVLRSVVQDHILPTVCYFGGGAEIAYFAQNSEVYRILGRPVTPIIHRQSFTIIESKHAKTLDRYGLELSDLFRGYDKLLPGIVEEYLNNGSAAIFADAEEKINTQLNRLDQDLSQIDPTLAANLANRRRKIIYHIGAVRQKFHKAQVRKDETIRRRLVSMFTSLTPNGQLQERTLNVTYFLNRYGPGFIDWVYDSIDLDDKSHRVLYL